MISIRKILDAHMLLPDETVYRDDSMLDYPIPTAGNFSLAAEDLDRKSYNKILSFQEKMNERIDRSRLSEIDREVTDLTRRTRGLLREGEGLDSPEVIALDERKKSIREEKKRIEKRAGDEAFRDVFGKGGRREDICSVCFKESMYAAGFYEFQSCHAAWTGPDYIPLQERPWFVSSLERVKELLSSGRRIGIEGGSCLFGTDEMRFILTLKNGEEHRFDFNTLQEIRPGRDFFHGSTDELFEFMQMCGDQVASAEVDCPKEAITIDEFEAVHFLFLLSRGLEAKLIITIPDMSYDKTFITLFSGLDDKIYNPFHEQFLSECRRMTDLSINLIRRLAQESAVKDYDIFYSGNEELCRIFHEKRTPFLDRYAKKFLTRRNGMMDALADYICMPAMPLYRYGIRDVIEVNRLEECPSIEKCRRIHRSALNLCDILYTQKPGLNGKTAGFYADMNHKEYIDEELFC